MSGGGELSDGSVGTLEFKVSQIPIHIFMFPSSSVLIQGSLPTHIKGTSPID